MHDGFRDFLAHGTCGLQFDQPRRVHAGQDSAASIGCYKDVLSATEVMRLEDRSGSIRLAEIRIGVARQS